MGRQNPRTDGKSKPIQTMSHKEAYTYTLIKRKFSAKLTTKPLFRHTTAELYL